jgi:signal peptidase II
MFLKKRHGFESGYPSFWKRYRVFLCLVFGIFLLDQASKFWAVDKLSEGFLGLSSFSSKVKKFVDDPPRPGHQGYYYRPKAGAQVEVVDNYLRFHYAENTGAAFSLFADWPEKRRRGFFHIISIVAVVFILYLQMKLPKVASRKEVWIRMGLPLVFAGAIGNYADRLARGFVVDFIQAHWQNKWFWPTFNVADMAISVGMACLILDAFLRKETKGQL